MYLDQVRANSEEIRDKILRHIMIRRTRSEIMEYYADDLKKQGLTFPKLGTPEPIAYVFDEDKFREKNNDQFDVLITTDVLAEELLKLAMHNTQRRFTGHVYNMMSIIESMMGRDAELDREVRNCFYEMESVYEDDICPMYVATNSKKLNGACVMLYDGLLRSFARKVGKSFYIIPSSIHEVILIPDTLDMDIRYMKAMVKEVNGTEVSPDEVLSDNVYRYDIDTDRIEMM